MGDPVPRKLRDYLWPRIQDIQSSIIRPTSTAKTFEIKPGIIQMIRTSVQFGGDATENPIMHIQDFIEICDTLRINNMSEDAIKLRLFPFSLRDKAKSWLHSLPAGSITTWEELAQKFLTKFFPMAKTAALRNAITQFTQQPGETLCEAWERYKDMLIKCPHHGMPDWMVINFFYNGLRPQSRQMVDAASGGALWAKSYEEAYELFEIMAANEYQNPAQRIAAQLEALSLKMYSLTNGGIHQVVNICEYCAGGHETHQCAISNKSVQYESSFQRQQHSMHNTYQPNYMHCHNFSWSNDQQGMQQPEYPSQNQLFGAEPYNPYEMQQQFQPPEFQQQQFHPDPNQTPSESFELEELRLMFKSQSESLKTLENQIGQIASALLNRPQGVLPSNIEANPDQKEGQEHVEAITLKSGKSSGGVEAEKTIEHKEVVQEQEKDSSNTCTAAPYAAHLDHQKEKSITSTPEKVDPPSYPPPPFPQRLQKLDIVPEKVDLSTYPPPLLPQQWQKQKMDKQFGIKAIKVPAEDEECFRMDMVNTFPRKGSDELLNSDSLDAETEDGEGAKKIQNLNAEPWHKWSNMRKESLGLEDLWKSLVRLKPYCEELPKLELQSLLDRPRYEYSDKSSKLPIIISTNLPGSEDDKLLRVLRKGKSASSWIIANAKEINSSYHSHKILCVEGSKPSGEQLRPSEPPPVPPPEEGGSS